MIINIFDTETTGFKAEAGGIAQFANISIEEVESGEIMVTPLCLFFTCNPINYYAAQATGLNNKKVEELSNAMTFKDHCGDLYKLLNNNVALGYNIPFDLRFLHAEFSANNLEIHYAAIECAFEKQKKISGQKKGNKLVDAVEYHKINTSLIDKLTFHYFGDKGATHDARWDAVATMLVAAKQGSELVGKAAAKGVQEVGWVG